MIKTWKEEKNYHDEKWFSIIKTKYVQYFFGKKKRKNERM